MIDDLTRERERKRVCMLHTKVHANNSLDKYDISCFVVRAWGYAQLHCLYFARAMMPRALFGHAALPWQQSLFIIIVV